jgi:Domain of unknown function (DUF4234)
MQEDQPGQGGAPEGGQPEQPQQPQPPPPPPAPEGQPPQGPVQPQGRALLSDEPMKVWLLTIFTFGIYGWFWYYRLCKELGEWSRGSIHTDPGTSVLAVTLGSCVVVPFFVSWVGTLGRIRQAQQMVGLEPKANFWPWFGLGFLLSYNYKWLQDQLNEIAARPLAPSA